MKEHCHDWLVELRTDSTSNQGWTVKISYICFCCFISSGLQLQGWLHQLRRIFAKPLDSIRYRRILKLRKWVKKPDELSTEVIPQKARKQSLDSVFVFKDMPRFMKALTSRKKFELIEEMVAKSSEEVQSCLVEMYSVSQEEAEQFIQFLSTETALKNEVT